MSLVHEIKCYYCGAVLKQETYTLDADNDISIEVSPCGCRIGVAIEQDGITKREAKHPRLQE